MPPLVTEFNEYKFDAELGFGSYGQVYRAYKEYNHPPPATKPHDATHRQGQGDVGSLDLICPASVAEEEGQRSRSDSGARNLQRQRRNTTHLTTDSAHRRQSSSGGSRRRRKSSIHNRKPQRSSSVQITVSDCSLSSSCTTTSSTDEDGEQDQLRSKSCSKSSRPSRQDSGTSWEYSSEHFLGSSEETRSPSGVQSRRISESGMATMRELENFNDLTERLLQARLSRISEAACEQEEGDGDTGKYMSISGKEKGSEETNGNFDLATEIGSNDVFLQSTESSRLESAASTNRQSALSNRTEILPPTTPLGRSTPDTSLSREEKVVRERHVMQQQQQTALSLRRNTTTPTTPITTATTATTATAASATRALSMSSLSTREISGTGSAPRRPFRPAPPPPSSATRQQRHAHPKDGVLAKRRGQLKAATRTKSSPTLHHHEPAEQGNLHLPHPAPQGALDASLMMDGTVTSTIVRTAASEWREYFAVKRINLSAMNQQHQRNLRDELTVLQRLSPDRHPYIVHMFEWEIVHKNVFIVMEYCPSGDLSIYLKQKQKLQEKDAMYFLTQLAAALKYLRRKEIAHLDLKPSNLLLYMRGSHPFIKLADFGFACNRTTTSLHSTLRGTPLYIAPEMLTDGLYDARADLWSVGVILYEALFGYTPYHRSPSMQHIRETMTRGNVRFPADQMQLLSLDCQKLLGALLQRDPNNRIAFDDFFSHKLVKLEYAPFPTSQKKALLAYSKYVSLKSIQQQQHHAYSALIDAIWHGSAALLYEANIEREKALEKVVEGWQKEATQMQHTLRALLHRPSFAQHRPPTDRTDWVQEVIQLQEVQPAFKQALLSALSGLNEGYRHDRVDEFEEATRCYDDALGLLVAAVRGEFGPKPPRRYQVELRKIMEFFLPRLEKLKVQGRRFSTSRRRPSVTNCTIS